MVDVVAEAAADLVEVVVAVDSVAEEEDVEEDSVAEEAVAEAAVVAALAAEDAISTKAHRNMSRNSATQHTPARISW